MAKLTLNVDEKVVRRAKRFAETRGTSVSRIVEQYLKEITGRQAEPSEVDPPILRSMRGLLKGTGIKDHRQELVKKYL
jgi:antitoxin component of RelBE/YafQ-DinJ toxin-antitoxin module